MMTEPAAPAAAAASRQRPRRSCLAVPGSSPRFLAKAQGLPADQVFLDLEDACAPLVKESARHTIVDALNTGDWGGKTRVVRVNDWTTHWTYRDVITVVEGAGPNLDAVMLPKVQDAGQVIALDLLLTQIEKTMGFEVGRIGIEAQIENARGLVNVDAIAAASPRLETIIFGPADFMASINMKSLVVGAAARLPRGRLPLHPDADPDGRPGPRPAGHRRPLPADPRTPAATGRSPAGRRRWGSTASGSCTRTRSRPPTRSSPPPRRTTTTRN